MSVTLLVRLIGKKGHGERLSQVLKPVPADNDIAGCLGIEVFRNSADGDDFLLLEQWQSIPDHQAHIANMEKTGGLKEMEGHIDSATRTYLEPAARDA